MQISTLYAGMTLFAAVLAAGPALAAGALVSAPIRGTYIFITHRENRDLAANIAMSRCMQRYGWGCRLVKAYDDRCLAIAQSSDGSHHSGWAVVPSAQAASLLAIGECAKFGSSCHLDVNVCE